MNSPISQPAGLAKGKRFIADGLSFVNLMCGVASIIYAAGGMLPMSLLMLLIGAALDGLDGAAARRWGGTRFGVYSDDIADGVNYGLAPGFALWAALGGAEGLVCGLAFTVFTLGRLVFFTLNKSGSDPNHFSGVPSTVGGVVALTSLILFPHQSAVVGLLVGVACALMVSFDTLHRHLGRLLAAHTRWIATLPAVGIALVVSGIALGAKVPAAIILTVSIAYGFLPTVMHFRRVIRAARRRKKGDTGSKGWMAMGGMG